MTEQEARSLECLCRNFSSLAGEYRRLTLDVSDRLLRLQTTPASLPELEQIEVPPTSADLKMAKEVEK